MGSDLVLCMQTNGGLALFLNHLKGNQENEIMASGPILLLNSPPTRVSSLRLLPLGWLG